VSRSLCVVMIEPLRPWVRDLYVAQLAADQFELRWALQEDESGLSEGIAGANVLVTARRRVTAAMIAAAGTGLRLVQVQGRAAYAVNLDAARDAAVPVSFMPHRGAIAVAEHAIALALGLYRKLVRGHAATVGGEYRELGLEPIETNEDRIAFNWMGLENVGELYGKTIGLVGLGDIGLEVARRARAFDMRVLCAKRSPLPSEHQSVMGISQVPLEELLRSSDIVSLHAPHTATTERLIDAAALSCMKSTAVLVNTSRGGLIDEKALTDSLSKRAIAGAALDVFLHEPLPADHPFNGLDNVLLSPHLGGGSGGGQKGMVADMVANLERVAAGQSPLHLVGIPTAGSGVRP